MYYVRMCILYKNFIKATRFSFSFCTFWCLRACFGFMLEFGVSLALFFVGVFWFVFVGLFLVFVFVGFFFLSQTLK